MLTPTELQAKRDRIRALRQCLANLSQSERDAMAARGLVTTVDGHTLSLHNTLLCYLQSDGHTPTVVGGYRQWRRAGRQVRRGEHGIVIWFPAGHKEDDGDDDDDDVTHFYTTTVFRQDQTDISNHSATPEPQPTPTPKPHAQPDIMVGWAPV